MASGAATVSEAAGQPQPGAVRGQFVYNGLPPVPVTAPGWPTLPARQAVNFVTATAIRLTSGSIYTVWGGATVEVGQYWSPGTFPTAEEFYGQDAVKLSWDTGQYLTTLQLNSLLILPDAEGLPVWFGLCSRQTAEDMDGNPLPGYFLPGGAQQYFVDASLLAVTSGPTAWNEPDSETSAPGSDAPDPVVVGGAVAGQDPSSLAAATRRLTGLLDSMADEVDRKGAPSYHLRQQQSRLDAAASAIEEEIAGAGNDGPEPSARLKTVAAGLIGVARYVEPLPETQHSVAAEAALDALVQLAYVFAGGQT